MNAKGERFMERYHPLLELAPRDVVARAITREGMDGPVYLDMRHVKKDLQARFPGISAFLAKYQLELGAGSDSGAAGGALSDGWGEDGCAWADFAAGAVCGGRGGLYGRAWSESAGEQFAAGGAGVWGAGGGDDGRREGIREWGTGEQSLFLRLPAMERLLRRRRRSGLPSCGS